MGKSMGSPCWLPDWSWIISMDLCWIKNVSTPGWIYETTSDRSCRLPKFYIGSTRRHIGQWSASNSKSLLDILHVSWYLWFYRLYHCWFFDLNSHRFHLFKRYFDNLPVHFRFTCTRPNTFVFRCPKSTRNTKAALVAHHRKICFKKWEKWRNW